MGSNVIGTPEAPLETFLGLNTEIRPANLQAGQSPDCADVVFLPGSVGTRPALSKRFVTAFPGSPTVVYSKTYVQPNGYPLNIYVTSDRNVYKEDVINSPGTYSLIGGFIAGGFVQSVSAFGREYFATSDGLHGLDIPWQYDGTNFDRVSQDGVAAAPTITESSTTYPIDAAPNGALGSLANNVTSGSQVGFTVTMIVVSAMGAEESTFPNFVGQQVRIAGVGAGYDGDFTIIGYSYLAGNITLTYTAGISGLGPVGAAGTATFTVAKMVLTVGNPFIIGDRVAIAGVGVGGYNGIWVVQAGSFNPDAFYVFTASFGLAADGGGTASLAGNIGLGTHQCVVMFLTRQGYITKPSPVVSWTTVTGNRIVVSDLPIGPPNVIARILAFTAAGGGNFFYIPVPITIDGVTYPSTVVSDNTSASATIDFADNILLNSIAIDIPGNNLFALVVLGPCLGLFPYANRLFAWGEYNKVQNFLNMGFDGGSLLATPTVPLGWSVDTAGGILTVGHSGQSWKITGDGTPAHKGQISQSAYQDSFNVPVLQSDTNYTFRFWGRYTTGLGNAGSIIAELSDSGGVVASASVPIASLGNDASGGIFVQDTFNNPTGTTIPSSLTLTVYASGQEAGAEVFLEELEMIFTDDPFLDQIVRGSYIRNQEAFDGVTGVLGIEERFGNIRLLKSLRDNLYLSSSIGLNYTSDNGTGEPSTWSVVEVSNSSGGVSSKAIDLGKEWWFIANRDGAAVFGGGDQPKVSQEIQPTWDSINWDAEKTIVVKNDIRNRRCYYMVPLGDATAPNVVLVLDYKELNGPEAIAGSPQGRKWTIWNREFNGAAFLATSASDAEFYFDAGNGEAYNASPGFGNVYLLDPDKDTDDDYGQIESYYTTYFLTGSGQGMALGIGGHRRLFAFISAYIIGVGQVSITPYGDELTNPWTATSLANLSDTPRTDLYWGLNVLAERTAFKIQSQPLEGETGNRFELQKLLTAARPDPYGTVPEAF